MEDNKTVQNKDLAKVTGGIETAFCGNVPICPVCGERPIKMVSGDEYTDTYQCHVCGSISVHTKKIRPEAPKPHIHKTCPRCGSVGKWRVIETIDVIDTVECTVCRLVTKAPTEPRWFK